MLTSLQQHPQHLGRSLALIAAASAAMLAFGIYLQEVVGLVPCPMCIVQRYALILVFVVAALSAFAQRRGLRITGLMGVILAAGFGACVAARQSWLQWYPPEIVNCGRDFYGMIENLPIKRALPMIFAGSGDCTKVDWSLLGLSIANWAFLFFAAVICAALLMLGQSIKMPQRSSR
jgi:protein dithiol:quinone oxidoreductase